MRLADGIRKHGFRKWYERELLQSHAHLALCFMAVVGVFAAFEASRQSQGFGDRAFDVFTIVLCSAVGVWSLRRYLFLLTHAEAVAHQADCPSCRAYARFNLLAENGEHVRVRCRKCEHEWQIDE